MTTLTGSIVERLQVDQTRWDGMGSGGDLWGSATVFILGVDCCHGSKLNVKRCAKASIF